MCEYTDDAKCWHERIKEHIDMRKDLIESNSYISKAMENYLKTAGDTDDFYLDFRDNGTVTLSCNGDLFDLEQIGGFCEVFNLELYISSRSVVEHHLQDTTTITTRYLFDVASSKKESE